LISPRDHLVHPQERIDDLQVYKILLALVEELELLSALAWSVASATALQAAAILIRKLASALYLAALRT
jgi:hypothetical protein